MKLIKWNNEPFFSDILSNFFENEIENLAWRRSCGIPATNIIEKDDAFVLEVVAPGLNKEDFKVDVENNVLTISSEKEESKEEKDKNYTRKEFYCSSFSRSFVLPKSVDSDKIKAEYKNGILYLDLPKKEEERTKIKKQIKIN